VYFIGGPILRTGKSCEPRDPSEMLSLSRLEVIFV
jgi:hypothetical protein